MHYIINIYTSDKNAASKQLVTLMDLPQVHLRKPCYDFYFLSMIKFGHLPGNIGNAEALPRTSPKTSLNHSIGSSDWRCVQRAGT